MAKWTDYLSADVYARLCNCSSTHSDVEKLVNAKWLHYKNTGKRERGFTKEDALIAVLELLDSNSQYIDLTAEEYDELKKGD